MKLSGTCSHFGGPLDAGVTWSEGLAFIFELDDAPTLFLPAQPPKLPTDEPPGGLTTGLARRLDSRKFYIACRWDYEQTSKEELLKLRVIVRAPKTGRRAIARPADWGPHEEKTGRVADLSPGLMEFLFGTLDATDEQVEVFIPVPEEETGRATTVVISSGHGLKIRGASGPPPWGLDEVDCAREIVPAVAARLRHNGCEVHEFHDDTSEDQSTNLATITDVHNSYARDLDVSVHLNCYNTTAEGTEVLYVSQKELATNMSAAIAAAGGLKDRGAIYRDDLYVLNNTTAPAVLVELLFCDNQKECGIYRDKKKFTAMCNAIADTIQPPPAVTSRRHPPPLKT